MLQINEIRLTLTEGIEEIPRKIQKKLRLKEGDLISWEILQESVDARNKKDIRKVYHVRFQAKDEKGILKRAERLSAAVKKLPEGSGQKGLSFKPDPRPGDLKKLKHRPVVVGFGPCGIFAALTLAQKGYRPIVLERGRSMDRRVEDVKRFWETGALSPVSNVQFGEGGAGAFSDGKLNTGIRRDERIRRILEALADAGAPGEILYKQKPHIGTDLLRETVVRLRERIEALGGEIRFESQLTDLIFRKEREEIAAIEINKTEMLETEAVILAPGHSARDTFSLLYHKGVCMEQKPFSIGARIEHLQTMIDESQYGDTKTAEILGAADYHLSYHCSDGRGVYTFCMCPGGYVVASASEEGGVVTNGMSYHQRNGKNANSAVLVSVGPEDFSDPHPLAGVAFQRKWEQAAFRLGGSSYRAPAQRTGDFMKGIPGSSGKGQESHLQEPSSREALLPTYRPGVVWADLSLCLPAFAVSALREALPYFGKKIKGFDREDGILTAVETRSSSPVRILRDKNTMQANVAGLFPAGEGAGYAGGIMSAAADGIRAAEAMMACWDVPASVQEE